MGKKGISGKVRGIVRRGGKIMDGLSCLACRYIHSQIRVKVRVRVRPLLSCVQIHSRGSIATAVVYC